MTRRIAYTSQKGFSMVELCVVLAIILLISAVALPSVTRMYRIYQLNAAASKMVDILKRTRFEAVRNDRVLSCRTNLAGPATTQVWADTNGDAAVQATESQILLAGPANLVASAGVPGTGALAVAVGSGAAFALNPISPVAGFITFDQRGAVTNPAGVSVFYLANIALADPGYRAVIVLPSGSVQVWQADSTGANWHLFD